MTTWYRVVSKTESVREMSGDWDHVDHVMDYGFDARGDWGMVSKDLSIVELYDKEGKLVEMRVKVHRA